MRILKISTLYSLIAFVFVLLLFSSCEKKDKLIPKVTVSTPAILFTVNGGSSELTITSNTDWKILSYDAPDWLQYSQSSGGGGSTTIKITATTNTLYTIRSATLLIATSTGEPIKVSVSQSSRSKSYPSYNLSPKQPDATGMSSTAVQLAAKIKLGWNIGNTLEAIGGETAWGNPKITEDLIKAVKQAGFNAVRIPCSWNQYADKTTAKIQDAWLTRVKEVVQYCVNNDVYAILNIHWDGGWLENNCTPEKRDSVNDKQKAFWEQIATALRDFDEHLIFASANEPNVSNATQMDVLLSYHQTFIDAVRSTGGKNAYRVLVVQGPMTDMEKTVSLFTTLPTDKVSNKMMVEVHWYAPYQFALMTADASWGNQFYYWGKNYHSTTDLAHNPTWGEESLVDNDFKAMKDNFVAKGIPVVLGEFDAIRRTNLTGDDLTLHLLSRAYFFKYVTKTATANGILPFYWDAGGGVINRKNNTVLDQQALDSMKVGAGL